MLKRLYIQNFAIISELELEFESKLNILTGETGAGKSILLGAISLLLGDRASTESIRHGFDRAVVEGSFQINSLHPFKTIFDEFQLEISDSIFNIRREITVKGQNRIFLNDQLITLQVLKLIGDQLVDLHGQHEHQSLLNPQLQLSFLDQFCNHPDLLRKFENTRLEYEALQKQLRSLEYKRTTLLEKKELFEFQLKEIKEVNPSVDEDSVLENELSVLENAEFLYQTSGAVAYSIQGNEEANIYHQLIDLKKKIDELAKLDKTVSDYAKEMEAAVISIKEIARFLEDYSQKITVDPEKLFVVKTRLDGINRLKKKYGPSLENVLKTKTELESSLSTDLNVDEQIEAVKTQIRQIEQTVNKLGNELSEKRKKGSKALVSMIITHLSDLGMAQSKFEIRFGVKENAKSSFSVESKKAELLPDGFDVIEFFISTNAGEPVKPLAKIASGGEISRIMLAIKASTATIGGVGVLIFDEIDTGVSGKIAFSVGKLLTKLSEHHQVFVITHLPQVASIPGDHFQVSKHVVNNHTETTVKKLSENHRIEEVAKLLSGEKVTDVSKTQAEELLALER